MIIFFSVALIMLFFASKVKEFFGYGIIYLWEDSIFYYISLLLFFAGGSFAFTKVDNKEIGVVLFTIFYIPFVLFAHVLITIILFKMNIELFFLSIVFISFWTFATNYLVKNFFPENLVSEIMTGILYVFIITVVFFRIVPQGRSYASAMIEKYRFVTKGEIIKKEKGSNRDFLITYRYTEKNGKELECTNSESIFNSNIKSLEKGDLVWIQYATKYPEYCAFQKKILRIEN